MYVSVSSRCLPITGTKFQSCQLVITEHGRQHHEIRRTFHTDAVAVKVAEGSNQVVKVSGANMCLVRF